MCARFCGVVVMLCVVVVDVVVVVHVFVVCVMNVLFKVSFFVVSQLLTTVDVKIRTIFYSKKLKK